MAFAHSVAETVMRTAATVAATVYAYLTPSVTLFGGASLNAANSAHTIQFELGTFTTGSVTASLQGSVDGTTWFDMPASTNEVTGPSYPPFTFSSATSGTRRYWDINGVTPNYLRVKLTKSGTPDGTVGVTYRTDGV